MKSIFNIHAITLICLMITSLFVQSGCKKVRSVTTETTCECPAFASFENIYGLTYISDTTNFCFWGQFNPNDDNEIMYLQGIENAYYMYRYNLVTHQKTLIHSFNNILNFDWNIHNEIVLTTGDGHIWKMKDNGDSLTQITNQLAYFYPQWNYYGDKIISYTKFSSTIYYSTILDHLGVIIDTISSPDLFFTASNGSWNNSNNLYVSSINLGAYISNIQNKTFLTFSKFPVDILETTWINDHELVGQATYGLYNYNIITGITKKLRCQCPNITYDRMKSNRDGTKLIMTRRKKNQIENTQNINVKSDIVIMNSDGTNEQVLEL